MAVKSMSSPLSFPLLTGGPLQGASLLHNLMSAQVSSRRPPGWYKQQYMSQSLASAVSMRSVDLVGHHGCVNSLDFSPGGNEWLASAGDDCRVLLWRVGEVMGRREAAPIIMTTQHTSNMFSAVFSCDSSFIYTGGNDAALIKHDFARLESVSCHTHLEAVYCVAPHPTSPHTLLSASEDGCVYIIDSREPMGAAVRLCKDMLAVQSVAINPVEPCLVGVADGLGVALYDTRQRKKVMKYFEYSLGSYYNGSAVSVCFNGVGSQLFAMYRDRPPSLFDLHDSRATQVFIDTEHHSYSNRVTLKSGCFMGQDDEYVVSGSDDFRVYIWKVAPSGASSSSFSEVEPHLVLPGHRSIVNQTRYSRNHQLLATSGVEKVVKVWSHLSLRADEVIHTSQDPPSRSRFQQLSDSDDLDVANSTLEDTTVLALFDRLVFHAETGEMLDSDSSLLGPSDEEEWSSDDDSMDSMDSMFGYGVRLLGYGDRMPWDGYDYDVMDDVSEVESNSSFLESMFGPPWAPPGWSDDVSSSSDDDTPPPTKKPPAKRPPIKKPPTKRPPAKRPPIKRPPTKRPPTKKPPAKRPPTKKPPADTQAGPSKRLTRSAAKQNLNTTSSVKRKKTKQNPLNNANIGEPSNRGKRASQKQPTLEPASHNSGGSSMRASQAKPKQPPKAHDTSASTSQNHGHSSTTTSTSKGKESSSGRPRLVKTPAAQGQGPSTTEQPIRSRRKQ